MYRLAWEKKKVQEGDKKIECVLNVVTTNSDTSCLN